MRFGTLKKFRDQFSGKPGGSVSGLFGAGGVSFAFPACEETDFEPLVRALKRALPYVSSIASSPVNVLKSRLVLQRAETAQSLGPAGIRETLRDMRVWTYRNGEIRPDYVYASENVEDPNIYENRLVKALIDRAVRLLAVCMRYSKGSVRTLRSLKSGGKLSRTDFIRLAGDKTDLRSIVGGGAEYVACAALRKKFLRLRGTEFYAVMSAFPEFEDAEPRNTDIFTLNRAYGECSDAWRSINRFESAISGLSGAERQSVYTAFASFALIRAYTEAGFKIIRNVYYENLFSEFSFDGLTLANDTFNVILSAAPGRISATVQCPAAKVQQRLTIGVYSGAADEPQTDDYLSIGLFDIDGGERFVRARPDDDDSAENLAAAAKLTVLTFGDESRIYEKICPVCGSTLVGESEYCVDCAECGAKYVPLKDGRTWINYFESYDPEYEKAERT